MAWNFSTLWLCLLALGLLWAAIGDLRTREIPNWLNGAIALGAIPFWLALGLAPWPDMAVQVALSAGVFTIFALLFNLGFMGGGDVKMLAALALWFPPGSVLALLVIMSLAGGALTLVMIARHRLSKREGAIEVPYGVAIAFAGCWLIAKPILNQFA